MRTIKGKVTWIDILKPTQADLDIVAKQHPFHQIILNEILQPSSRARMEHYDGYMFIVYHLPVYDAQLKTSRRAEIDFLITKDLIVTARHEPLEQIDQFLQTLMRDAQMQQELLKTTTFIPLYKIIEHIIEFSMRQLRHIEESVAAVAGEIFNNKEEELLKEISYIKRNILDYRLIVRPQEALFHSLHAAGLVFWGEKSRVYLNDLLNDHINAIQNLENSFEIIESLETTNSQLLEARSGAIMKVFTIGAFLFSIPFLYIFMLDIKYIGDVLLASPLRFWSSFTAMLAGVWGVVWVLKKKRIL